MTDPDRRPRRAIVTGGAGFIGGHLVEHLLAGDDAVLVLDDLSTGVAGNVPAGVAMERRDIATDDLDGLFAAWRPDIVFHLAAQASVPVSSQVPLRDLAVNVVGTHRVAAAARASGARRLVFVSSGGAIYGDTETAATEATPVAPESYYGVHKLAAEGHVALAGIPWAVARPSNVYGSHQPVGLDGAVVAAFLDQAARTGRLRIHGDGHQTRDFVHVDDVVAALDRLARDDLTPGVWNVASGRSITILELADAVERALGTRLGRDFSAARAGDVRHSTLAADRLHAVGWRPMVDLDAGLAALAGAVAVPGDVARDGRDDGAA